MLMFEYGHNKQDLNGQQQAIIYPQKQEICICFLLYYNIG